MPVYGMYQKSSPAGRGGLMGSYQRAGATGGTTDKTASNTAAKKLISQALAASKSTKGGDFEEQMPGGYGTQNYGFLGNQQPTIGGQKADLYAGTNLESLSQEPGETITEAWHSPFEQKKRRYLGSAGALREALGYAYGINPGGQIGKRAWNFDESGEVEALDPIVRLENALFEQYKNYKSDDDEERNKSILNRVFRDRGKTLNALMRQRSAAMGTPGLYQPAMAANESIRDTLSDQALAAYKPVQSAMERQYEQQNQELLNTLQQIQSETETSIRSIGRAAGFSS